MNNNNLFDLEVSVDSVEENRLGNGEDSFIIYLKIYNKLSKERKINLSLATYVTCNFEQLEQNIWITGYLSTGNSNLKANAFRKAGLAFYKKHLKQIRDNDSFEVNIELIQEKKKIICEFVRLNDNWLIRDSEIQDIEIEITPKMLAKQMLKRVERLEAFEERCGIYFENLSINIMNGQYFKLFGEIHASSGSKLKNNIEINCIIYDKDNNILEKGTTFILSDKFFVFEVFEFNFYTENIANQVHKIRLFPKGI